MDYHTGLSLFEIGAALLGLSALFGWANHAFIKLPHTIALLIMALFSSLLLLVLEILFPAFGITDTVQAGLGQIDFNKTVMNGMLAFLLFAGALHVDLGFLKSHRWAIGSMATLGVIISTFIVGTGFWLLAKVFGIELPYIWALVFGALISPTDPVAVLSILKTVNMPHSLEAKIAGESLFNDGVGVVVFLVMVAIAVPAGGEHVTALHIAELFAVETGGGVILGLLFGWIANRMLGRIDEYSIEILITLGIVTVLYAVCMRLHLSGPIAVVVAGLLIGNRGAQYSMSEQTRTYMFGFWELIDEILNSVLFLLIGLELLILTLKPAYAGIALLAIPLVLLARFTAVSIPMKTLSIWQTFTKGAIPVLTWGGVRGGISVALALSLPPSEYKPLILTATYAVVVFSIVVQGLTVKPLVKKVIDPDLL